MYRVGQYGGAGKQYAADEFDEGKAQVEKKRPGNIALAGGWRAPASLFSMGARPVAVAVMMVVVGEGGGQKP